MDNITHKSSCWEHSKCCEFNNDIDNLIATKDIPSFTRFYVEQPDKVYMLPKYSFNLSTDKIEENMPTNDIIAISDLFPCHTPLTNQLIGYAKLSSNSILAKTLTEKEDDKKEIFPNSMVIIDFVNNWKIQLYSLHHIKKGDIIKLYKPKQQDDTIFNEKSWMVMNWFPKTCYYLSDKLQNFFPSRISNIPESNKSKKSNHGKSVLPPTAAEIKFIKQIFSWNEFILLYALYIMIDHESFSVHRLFLDFDVIYTPSRRSYPLLFCTLFNESMINSQINNKWFSWFGATLFQYILQYHQNM